MELEAIWVGGGDFNNLIEVIALKIIARSMKSQIP